VWRSARRRFDFPSVRVVARQAVAAAITRAGHRRLPTAPFPSAGANETSRAMFTSKREKEAQMQSTVTLLQVRSPGGVVGPPGRDDDELFVFFLVF